MRSSRPGTTPSRAIEQLRAAGPLTPEVETLVTFVREARRGVVLARRRGSGPAADEGEA